MVVFFPIVGKKGDGAVVCGDGCERDWVGGVFFWFVIVELALGEFSHCHLLDYVVEELSFFEVPFWGDELVGWRVG